MTVHPLRSNRETPVIVGVLLVVAGVAAFLMQQAGVQFDQLIGDAGWPFFVIVPGLALLLGAFLVPAPRGAGFAISGSIVTTIGLILLFQNATDRFETWAYVWALIPGAAGAAMVVYGSVVGERGLVAGGARLAVIATVLFVVGLWFFEPVLSEGRVPFDVGTWWPAVLVTIGILIVGSSLFGSASRERDGSTDGGDAARRP
jgi:hypothetical protein